MKKTVTVNLDKTIFNIDDDAYTVLESYLEALHDHFKKEEGGQEIMNDIESRISELFKERLGFGMQVITLQEVNEVIAIMGQPDEIENPLNSGTAPDNNADGDNSGKRPILRTTNLINRPNGCTATPTIAYWEV